MSPLLLKCVSPRSGGSFDRLARRIARFEQVISCYLISGGYDLLVMVDGRDLLGWLDLCLKNSARWRGCLDRNSLPAEVLQEKGFLFGENEEVSRLPVTP